MLLFKKVTLTAQSQRMDRLEQIGRELLRRNPPKQVQEVHRLSHLSSLVFRSFSKFCTLCRNSLGNIVYGYASQKTVAELRELKGQNKNQFVLALEKIIYKGSPKEMELCLMKYYDIPESLREDVWRKAKDALNSRVRRLRKAIRDGQISTQNVDRENEFSRLDLYD
ncbi:hypothetical protein COOONC_18666 [Cooperia oncophora]